MSIQRSLLYALALLTLWHILCELIVASEESIYGFFEYLESRGWEA